MKHLKLSADITEASLLATIQQLNFDPSVHGILLQLPLDSNNDIDADKCTNAIAIEKVILCMCVCVHNSSQLLKDTEVGF